MYVALVCTQDVRRSTPCFTRESDEKHSLLKIKNTRFQEVFLNPFILLQDWEDFNPMAPRTLRNSLYLTRASKTSKDLQGSPRIWKDLWISKNLKRSQKISKDPLRISKDHQTFAPLYNVEPQLQTNNKFKVLPDF